jgi:hypothetical protein
MRRKVVLVAGAAALAFAMLAVTARVAPAAVSVEGVMDRVGEVIEKVWEKLKDFIDDIGNDMPQAAENQSQDGDEFTWTGSMVAGSVLEIRGTNGEISATAASGSTVEIIAIKESRRSDVRDVTVQVIEHDGGVTVCAVYPTPDGKADNRCGPEGEYRMSVQRNDTQVDFEVRVPAGVRLEAHTVNGEVEAIGLESDASIYTVNGDIELSTTGYAEAETVNGSIEAILGSGFERGVTFSTVNGSIDLDVPDDIDADLSAKWVNGDLTTDLPFQLQGRVSRTSARGTLGDGGPSLELETVNGSIRIR